MVRESLYRKTVDILVQAYFNDTLEHGNYCGCAVGNIIAAGCGVTLVSTGKYDNRVRPSHWLSFADGEQDLTDFKNNSLWYRYTPYSLPIVKEQIAKTGYSYEELMRIEKSFERADAGESDDEFMFNGLMSVIETLDIIHENTDTSITETSKKRFDKTLQTV